jgi:hypothetical protein
LRAEGRVWREKQFPESAGKRQKNAKSATCICKLKNPPPIIIEKCANQTKKRRNQANCEQRLADLNYNGW